MVITGYSVTHRATGNVRTYKTLQRATRAADRADNAYGAYICTVRTLYAPD